MSNTKLFSMRAITNMHAGSGDNNYGVVDKLIQRDTVDKMPTIHSSSLKGALREFFKYLPEPDKIRLEEIFGSESNSQISKQGNYIFFDADFVSFPLRSDKAPFFNATSPERLKKIIEKAKLLGIEIHNNCVLKKLSEIEVDKNKPIVFDKKYEGAIIEDHSLTAKYQEVTFDLSNKCITDLIGEKTVLLNDCDFRAICEDMPVMARNQLESGESKNLWYEEIVPHQSRFAFFVSQSNNSDLCTYFDKITENRVQVGANATIGYGQTDINEINLKTNENENN